MNACMLLQTTIRVKNTDKYVMILSAVSIEQDNDSMQVYDLLLEELHY